MIKNILKFFNIFGITILKNRTFEKYQAKSDKLINLNLLNKIDNFENIKLFLKNLEKSKSRQTPL